MSLGLERSLVGILDDVRRRTNITFKRFHPNKIVSLSPASTRRLSGVKDLFIDKKNGGSDPVRRFLGNAKKCSGNLEHVALQAVRNSAHTGIHAVRTAEVNLLAGYNHMARLELTSSQQFQLRQAQQHLPEIPVFSAAFHAIGQSMAKVDLALPTDRKNNILATDRNGEIINRNPADIVLTGISRLLLGFPQNPDN